MPGIAIKPNVLAEIQRQYNHELAAAHAYIALSIWCDNANLKGFARYFAKQAGEEREHALKFIKHLLDRGAPAPLTEIPAPRVGFLSILEVAKHAQAMERTNTLGIHACYQAALADNDYPAQVLLHWFINEQVEEEDWTDEMVERVEAANCAGGMSDLDRHIERYLKEDGVGTGGGE
jgi:ferritin